MDPKKQRLAQLRKKRELLKDQIEKSSKQTDQAKTPQVGPSPFVSPPSYPPYQPSMPPAPPAHPSPEKTHFESSKQKITLAYFINEFQIPSKPKVEKYSKSVEAKFDAPSAAKKEEDDFEPYYSDEEIAPPKKDFRPPRASTVEVHRQFSSTPAKQTPKKPVEEELTKEQIKQMLETRDFQVFFERSSCLMEKVLGSISFDPFFGLNDYDSDDQEDRAKKSSGGIALQSKYFEPETHRVVTNIDWNPKKEQYFLASYSRGNLVTEPDGLVSVWSMLMKKRPQISLKFHSEVTQAMFDPFQNNIVVGGTYSGYIVEWDTRAGAKPIKRTSIAKAGHSQPIYSLAVVGTSASRNIVSLSNDGHLCIWSMQMLNEPQTHFDLKFSALNSGSQGEAKIGGTNLEIAANCLAFPDEETNNFYVGSVDGNIYHSQLHPKKSYDENVIGQLVDHTAPVLSLSAHPHQSGLKSSDISNLILSSSMDWSIRLWNPKRINRSVYTFESAEDYVYDAQWSPTHPSVFASCDGEGNIDLWDIVKDIEAPYLKHKAEIHAIHKLKWSMDSRRILTGSAIGEVAIWSVDKELVLPRPDDFKNFEMMVDV